MAMSRPKLGSNPLVRGIFNKTEITSDLDDSIKKPESRRPILESSFLIDEAKEKVNLRLPQELNDWLDDLLKKGKRTHGHKISKEIWVQAALELFKAMPVDWHEVDGKDSLIAKLRNLESRIKQLESQ